MENQVTPLTYPEKNTGSDFKDIKAGHVGIRTTKYNELLKWYEENLDFRIIRKWMVDKIQLAFIAPPNNDDFIIEVICYDPNEKVNNEGIKSGFNHLSFWVNDLDKTVDLLKKRNISIERSFSVPTIAMRVAFISDTFGNTIEFCEHMKQN